MTGGRSSGNNFFVGEGSPTIPLKFLFSTIALFLIDLGKAEFFAVHSSVGIRKSGRGCSLQPAQACPHSLLRPWFQRLVICARVAWGLVCLKAPQGYRLSLRPSFVKALARGPFLRKSPWESLVFPASSVPQFLIHKMGMIIELLREVIVRIEGEILGKG